MSEFCTKDSGTREIYDSGMQRDTQAGKPRFDLIMPEGVPLDQTYLYRWAMLMTRGAEKYGDRNWENGNSEAEYRRAMASAFRHFMQWYAGVNDGEDHAVAVAFNIQAAEYFKYKRSEPAPRPSRHGASTEASSHYEQTSR